MTDEELSQYERLGCLEEERWGEVRDELVAEVRRLRGLMQQVEWAASENVGMIGEAECPWCRSNRPRHEPSCPAFPPEA